ncbi:MAG: hypothetical protein MK137_06850 [Rickettsiales bacterium]|nr:hypothetical protein [Rickettsiales bacterium]
MKQPRRGSNSSAASATSTKSKDSKASEASDHNYRGTEAAFEAFTGSGGLEAIPGAGYIKDGKEVYDDYKKGKKASAATTALGVAADTLAGVPGIGGGVKYLADTARGKEKFSTEKLLYASAPGGSQLAESQDRALSRSSSRAPSRFKPATDKHKRNDASSAASSLLSRAAERKGAASRFLKEDQGVSGHSVHDRNYDGLRRRRSGRDSGSGMGSGYY